MIKITALGKGFEISRNGRTIYSATVGTEVFRVGNGTCVYSMNRGSFSVREKITKVKGIRLVEAAVSPEGVDLWLTEGSLRINLIGERVEFRFSDFDSYNRLWIKIPAAAREHIYGCGEIFTEFDLRGKTVDVWVSEHINAASIAKKLVKIATGRRDSQKKEKFEKYETYYAQPTFLSSDKYYFHSFASSRVQFDFTNARWHGVKMDSVSDFVLGFGDTFEDVMGDITAVVGRQPELPDWVYDGEILGIQGGTELMMSKVDNTLRHGMKVNGVWIQDWEGRRITAAGKQLMWNWEWDRELYPRLDEKIKELNLKGIKVLGYCNPFLAIEKPLYDEATEKGYCVKDKDGDDYLVKITTFPAAMLDLTNPEAWEWMKNIIKKNMIEFGLSGWMADFGEYLPTDCVLYSGEDAELVHNTWPARWAQLNREAVEESGKLGEIMFFTRAGYSDTPRYSTMMWNGDNHVDFSVDYGLPSVIPAMLSLTCCGFGLSHSDIAGYTTFAVLRRSEELYMRWAEMNAFSPLMRGHEGLNPDLNAQFDASDEVLNHSVRMSRIHAALKPYIKEAVKYNAEKGVGVVRPLFFHYNEDRAYKEGYEYLLGRDILVAPVLRPKADSREVWLPDDEWIHLWSGKEYKGGTVTVPAPVGNPPVFVRKNADPALLEIIKNMNFGG
ncbi:MAG: alpha-glucosidase [Clostridia bacterium]|nr:alpha-glucosidase [Clostridia bacterium]